jgi:hypothetical protein
VPCPDFTALTDGVDITLSVMYLMKVMGVALHAKAQIESRENPLKRMGRKWI